MACPYFMPVVKLEGGGWLHPARLPLGAGWSGHCTAAGHEGETPSVEILESCCNLGYASRCVWAPAERTWDAVRFAVLAPKESERTLRLQYVCERNHAPAAHGVLEFDLMGAAWLQTHDDARLQKMAQCFVESYLKKKA